MAYLATKLEGDATRLVLADVNDATSWYELLNKLTYQGRFRPHLMQRRYEVAGGDLLNWFMYQGRRRPPWRRKECEWCDFRDEESVEVPPEKGGVGRPRRRQR